MISVKQRTAASENIKKAQARWKLMSSRQYAIAQPQGKGRAKPGTKGKGEYYRIEVSPKEEFVTFRYHDVGKPGEIQRLAGKRSNGAWDDQAWLISKDMAHREGNILVADTAEAEQILEAIGPTRYLKGDIFEGHPRKNVPERKKPTEAQKKARMENIYKAQQARWSTS